MLHVHICIKVALDWQIVEEKRFSTTRQASAVIPRMSRAGETQGRSTGLCYNSIFCSENYWIEKLKEEEDDEYYYDYQ